MLHVLRLESQLPRGRRDGTVSATDIMICENELDDRFCQLFSESILTAKLLRRLLIKLILSAFGNTISYQQEVFAGQSDHVPLSASTAPSPPPAATRACTCATWRARRASHGSRRSTADGATTRPRGSTSLKRRPTGQSVRALDNSNASL